MSHIRVIVIFLLLISIMCGCKKTSNNDDLIEIDMQLNGESEHWKATYDAEGYVQFYDKNGKLMMESDGNYIITLDYKGTLSEISTLRTIKVEYLTTSSEKTSSDDPDSLTYTYKGTLHANDIIDLSQENKVEIKVTWDGSNGNTEIISVK